MRKQPRNEPVIFGSGGTFGGVHIIDFTTSASRGSVREYFARLRRPSRRPRSG